MGMRNISGLEASERQKDVEKKNPVTLQNPSALHLLIWQDTPQL